MNMIEIIVPATTANIGPGFDCLGMALNLYNRVLFEETEEGLEINGCDEKFKNENNLVYISMIKTFEKLEYDYKGIKITMDCDIPESRGLGSSAACILSGVMGANEIAKGNLTKNDILEIATSIEGHPDNIAPALFGGMVVSIYDEGKVHFSKIPIKNNIKLYTIIPDFTLSTKESRSVLPKDISFNDATFNIGRTALMIGAFANGDMDLLKTSIQDKLHQNYRGPLIPEYDTIIKELNNLEVNGTFLSGAGPTIIAIGSEDKSEVRHEIEKILLELKNKWILKELIIENKGAIIKGGNKNEG